MGLLALLYKTKTDKLGTLEIHATLREGHETTNEITEHPVELGANIVDHVRTKPCTLVIEGVVTNTPVRNLLETASERFKPGEPGLSQEAFDKLWKLAESHELIEVATSMKLYRRMVIASITAPRDPSTGEALRFTATLREIRLVQTKAVQGEVKVAKHSPKQRKQKQETKPATQPEQLKSVSARVVDFAKGALQ